MRYIFYIVLLTISLPISAQEITIEQEIELPDYLLSPTTEEDIIQEDNTVKKALSFEDELEMLLKAEAEILPLYQFNASVFVLNKNTNNVQKYSLESNSIILHGSLEIKALNCLNNYESLSNNDYVFLDIQDKNTKTSIYRGWMSRRLPGINPFNHSTYTVRVTGCKLSHELIIEEEPDMAIPSSDIEESAVINDIIAPSQPLKPSITIPDNIILLPNMDNYPLKTITQ